MCYDGLADWFENAAQMKKKAFYKLSKFSWGTVWYISICGERDRSAPTSEDYKQQPGKHGCTMYTN